MKKETTAKAYNLMMSEEDLVRDAIEAAHLYGWLVAHFRQAMTKHGNWVTPVAGDGKGFPDLVLVHPESETIIFAECKSSKGRLTEEQKIWIKAVGGQVWRPQDWDRIVWLLQFHATNEQKEAKQKLEEIKG